MKTCLALLLVLLPVAAGYAADNVPSPADHAAASAGKPFSARELRAKVSDIARSPALTPAEKKERIAATVRNAVARDVAILKTPREMLRSALRFATIAAEAAPQFADEITHAVLSIPAIAAIDGAAAKIETAVVDAATRAAGAEFSSNRPKGPRDPEFGGRNGDTVVSRYR